MGVYVYSVRTKNVTAEVDGVVQPIYALGYLGRSCPEWNGLEHRTLQLGIERAHSVWERRGEKPKYVALLDDKKFATGCPVYEWDGRPCDYDTPRFDGAKRLAGYLRKGKKGRKTVWTVEPALYSVSIGSYGPSGRIARCFHIKLSESFFTPEEALHYAKAYTLEGEVANLSVSEAGQSRYDVLGKPSESAVEATVNALLLGAPVKDTRTADYLTARGECQLYREEDGALSYRLTNAGLRRALGCDPKLFSPLPKLTEDRVVFTGGKYGDHSLDRRCSNLARVKAHWEGYCEAS